MKTPTIDSRISAECGLSMVEAMFAIAILAIASLAIGSILIGSFQQTNTAEQVLNAQLYGMSTGVAGTYSAASNIILGVNIDQSTAQNTSIPDAVLITGVVASVGSVDVPTAPIISGVNTPIWWLP